MVGIGVGVILEVNLRIVVKVVLWSIKCYSSYIEGFVVEICIVSVVCYCLLFGIIVKVYLEIFIVFYVIWIEVEFDRDWIVIRKIEVWWGYCRSCIRVVV